MKLILSALVTGAMVLVPAAAEAKRPGKVCTTTVAAGITSKGPTNVTRVMSCPIRSRR